MTMEGKTQLVILSDTEDTRSRVVSSFLKLLISAEEDVEEGRMEEAASFFREFKHCRDI